MWCLTSLCHQDSTGEEDEEDQTVKLKKPIDLNLLKDGKDVEFEVAQESLEGQGNVCSVAVSMLWC